MTQTHAHRPVLLQETLTALNIRADGIYIDGTFGRGGHSRAILDRLGPQGRLYAMDKDPQAVRFGMEALANEPRFQIVQGTFAMLEQQAQVWGVAGNVNGVLLDLGVSSPQLDQAERGFSFRQQGPLDMRMDPSSGESAAAWLARASEQEIAFVLKTYGEERFAKRIARAIVNAAKTAPITTTKQLAEIVAKAHPAWEKGKDPATRTFQAIRIHVNRELDDLEAVLPQALTVLALGGRLAIISFHSLEDRIVKRFIREQARGDQFPPDLPVTYAELQPKMRAVGKAVRPGADEVRDNVRARSSVLRVAEKLA